MSNYARLLLLRALCAPPSAPAPQRTAMVHVRDAALALPTSYSYKVRGHDAARFERLQSQIAESIGASHADLRTHSFDLINAATGAPVRTNHELDTAVAKARGAPLWLRYEVGARLRTARPAVPELAAAKPAAARKAVASSSSAAAAPTVQTVADAICANVAAVAAGAAPGHLRDSRVRVAAEKTGAALLGQIGARAPHELAGAVARDLVHAVNDAEATVRGRDQESRVRGFKVLLARDPVWQHVAQECGTAAPQPSAVPSGAPLVIADSIGPVYYHKTVDSGSTKLDSVVEVVKDSLAPANSTGNTMEGRDHLRERGFAPIGEQLVGNNRDKDKHKHKHHHHGHGRRHSWLGHDLLGIHGEIDAPETVSAAGAAGGALDEQQRVGCHRDKDKHHHHHHHSLFGRAAHVATGGLLHSESKIGAELDDDLVPLGRVGAEQQRVGCHRDKDKDGHHHHHHSCAGRAVHDLLHSESKIGAELDDDLVPLSRVGASRAAAALDDDLVLIGADKCSVKHLVKDIFCGMCHRHHAEGKCPMRDLLGVAEHPHRDRPMTKNVPRNLLFSANEIGASRAAALDDDLVPLSRVGASRAAAPLDDDLVPLSRVGASRAAALDDDLVPLADLKRAGARPQQVGTGVLYQKHPEGLLSPFTSVTPKKDASYAMLVIGNGMCHKDGEADSVELFANGESLGQVKDGSTKQFYVPGGVVHRIKVMRGTEVLSPEHAYKFEPNHVFPAILTPQVRKLAFMVRAPRVDVELFGERIGARLDSSISGVTVSLADAAGKTYRLGAEYAAVPSDARYVHISAGGQSKTKPEPLDMRPGEAHSIAVYRDATGAVAVHAQSDARGERVRAAAASQQRAFDFGAF